MNETWDGIADWYVALVRDGSALHEFSRDILLTKLPGDLTDTAVLDVGCGEGMVTRALAGRGAAVLGIDVTPAMVAHARDAEEANSTGARFRADDATTLFSVGDHSVDWVIAALSLNNVPDLTAALEAIGRVLTCEGHLVFTVPHPCFDAPNASSVTVNGVVRRLVGDYLGEGFWRSDHPESVRRAGNYHRTVATYLGALLDSGFRLVAVEEPKPSFAVAQANPHRSRLPPFLLVHATRTHPEC